MLEFGQRRTQNSYLISAAKPERATPGSVHTGNPLLAQQQVLGNQAMQRFGQSCPLKLPTPSVCPFGGICHICPTQIQAKLKVSKPGDLYEQEADRVAENVMRMPKPQLQHAYAYGSGNLSYQSQNKLSSQTIAVLQAKYIQRQLPTTMASSSAQEITHTPGEFFDPTMRSLMESQFAGDFSRLQKMEHPTSIQCKEADDDAPLISTIRRKLVCSTCNQSTTSNGVEKGIDNLRGHGVPLPNNVRIKMESGFGVDFSGVRIHTGNQSAQLNKKVNAKAFTVGNNIFFNKGTYSPLTDEGQRLLAHELAHVVQQNGSVQMIIQRRVGEDHDLQSPRFSGNIHLEMVYDGKLVIKEGWKGNAILLIQEALIALGYSLPRLGADGNFGNETRNAVIAFQTNTHATIDGRVGPETMRLLDERDSEHLRGGPAPSEKTTPGEEKEIGYTQCDFIHGKIDVDAQYSLYHLYKKGGSERSSALNMWAAVKEGEKLDGIYQQDRKVPALKARTHGEDWWTMITDGDAMVYPLKENEFPGEISILVYKKSLASNIPGLAKALQNAWSKRLDLAPSSIPDPSGKICPPKPKRTGIIEKIIEKIIEVFFGKPGQDEPSTGWKEIDPNFERRDCEPGSSDFYLWTEKDACGNGLQVYCRGGRWHIDFLEEDPTKKKVQVGQCVFNPGENLLEVRRGIKTGCWTYIRHRTEHRDKKTGTDNKDWQHSELKVGSGEAEVWCRTGLPYPYDWVKASNAKCRDWFP